MTQAYNLPDLSQPNWTENYLAGLTSISDPRTQGVPSNVPFSPVSANGVLPVVAPSSGWMSNLKGLGSWFGKNGQNINTWANIIGQGLQAYVGLQQLGLAKSALKFEKNAFQTNLRNSVQSYNTQMQDRINGRYYATEEERQKALRESQLSDQMSG